MQESFIHRLKLSIHYVYFRSITVRTHLQLNIFSINLSTPPFVTG